MDKKEYGVAVHFSGELYYTIFAESEDEAIEIAREVFEHEGDYTIGALADVDSIECEEIEG